MSVFGRASYDSLAPPSKKKAQTEGEDTEEDVEEQKVIYIPVGINKLHGLQTPPVYSHDGKPYFWSKCCGVLQKNTKIWTCSESMSDIFNV